MGTRKRIPGGIDPILMGSTSDYSFEDTYQPIENTKHENVNVFFMTKEEFDTKISEQDTPYYQRLLVDGEAVYVERNVTRKSLERFINKHLLRAIYFTTLIEKDWKIYKAVAKRKLQSSKMRRKVTRELRLA